MAKTVTAALSAHMSQDVTTMVTCWRIIRSDGVVLGFTDHVADIVVSGITYEAETGYTPTSLESNSKLAVDNLDIVGGVDSDGITKADIDAKKYDAADISLFMVNYNDPDGGHLKLIRGKVGNITVQDNSYIVELRSLTQLLQQTIGEKYSERCRAELGDSRCNASVPADTVAVTSVESNRVFFASALVSVVNARGLTSTVASSYYDSGLITWEASSANSTYTAEVKVYASGRIELREAMPYQIVVTDVFTINPGCLKRITEDCVAKFNNSINFRGEPFVPGIDKITKVGGAA